MIRRYGSPLVPIQIDLIGHQQNTFRALYRTFTQCCFIEDDGDIIFYKNKDGEAVRFLAEGVLGSSSDDLKAS